MPASGSGEIFGTRNVPKGEASANPPPKRVRSVWPGEAWQDPQSAAAKTSRPRAGSPDPSSSAASDSEKAGLGADRFHALARPTKAASALRAHQRLGRNAA